MSYYGLNDEMVHYFNEHHLFESLSKIVIGLLREYLVYPKYIKNKTKYAQFKKDLDS